MYFIFFCVSFTSYILTRGVKRKLWWGCLSS